MTQLTEHFSREEMQCPCCKACEMDMKFMVYLEELRVDFKKPLRINSGFRCQKHNDSLPNSSPRSYHTRGAAADISWDEFNTEERYQLLDLALDYFRGIGVGKSYLHVDIGDNQKLWVY